MPDGKLKKPWVVEMDLDGGEDFRERFSTREDAVRSIEASFERGYVARDEINNPKNKYETVLYPISRIVAVRLFEQEITGTTGITE